MGWLWLLPLAVDTTDWRFALVVEYSYIGVFLFLVACGLGFPSPEEVALIGGGFAVHKAGGGWPAVLGMVAVAMTGVLVGDVMLWSIGRRVGSQPHKLPIIGRHLTPDRMERARKLFAVHGAKAVFFGRFLFGIRAVTFFVSGSLRVPLSTFILMDGLAALLSVPISVILAWYFGAHLEEAVAWIGQGNRVLLVAIGAVAAIVVLVAWRRHRAAIRGSGPQPDGGAAASLEGPERSEDPGPAEAGAEEVGPPEGGDAPVEAGRAGSDASRS